MKYANGVMDATKGYHGHLSNLTLIHPDIQRQLIACDMLCLGYAKASHRNPDWMRALQMPQGVRDPRFPEPDNTQTVGKDKAAGNGFEFRIYDNQKKIAKLLPKEFLKNTESSTLLRTFEEAAPEMGSQVINGRGMIVAERKAELQAHLPMDAVDKMDPEQFHLATNSRALLEMRIRQYEKTLGIIPPHKNAAPDAPPGQPRPPKFAPEPLPEIPPSV